jgi:hypothetical protein
MADIAYVNKTFMGLLTIFFPFGSTRVWTQGVKHCMYIGIKKILQKNEIKKFWNDVWEYSSIILHLTNWKKKALYRLDQCVKYNKIEFNRFMLHNWAPQKSSKQAEDFWNQDEANIWRPCHDKATARFLGCCFLTLQHVSGAAGWGQGGNVRRKCGLWV